MAAGLTLVLFTEMTPPPGSSGGLLNAILGSLIVTVLGVAFRVPLGMLAGTYMAEYGRYSKLTFFVRSSIRDRGRDQGRLLGGH